MCQSNIKANGAYSIEAIGARICALREARGETQKELADALGVKRETVNQWENGSRDLKTQYTINLADHFGVTCDEILRGVKSENVAINRKIGLSDEAIDVLLKMFEKNKATWHIDVLNKLIEWGDFSYLLAVITDYISTKCYNEDVKLPELTSVIFTHLYHAPRMVDVLTLSMQNLFIEMVNDVAAKEKIAFDNGKGDYRTLYRHLYDKYKAGEIDVDEYSMEVEKLDSGDYTLGERIHAAVKPRTSGGSDE